MKKIKGPVYLFLAALIWGSAFIFQKMGMDYIGPLTFSFFRFTLGSLALIPVVWLNSRKVRRKQLRGRADSAEVSSFRDGTLIKGSIICGFANFAAGALQQIGIVYTTAGKAGFISAMDILIVPIILLFMRKKISKTTWAGILAAPAGLYLLCINEGFTLQRGDAFIMACSVGYAFQIIAIDHYAKRVDPLKLSFLQFLVAGALSGVAALIFEDIDMAAVMDCIVPVLYVAVFEVSIAFTLQIVGQKYTHPAVATVIMSLESVFAALCGAVFLGETMTGREKAGCLIMFAAFMIAQISDMRSPSDRKAPAEKEKAADACTGGEGCGHGRDRGKGSLRLSRHPQES